MTKAEEEQVKISAAYLKGVAVAVFAIGGLAPFFGFIYAETDRSRPLWVVAVVSVVCLCVSVGLHLVARRILKGLQS